MAHIIGEIESLKRIKQELAKHGITRFNSVGELNRFIRDYEQESQAVFEKVGEE